MDIADMLDVTQPSVFNAMGKLSADHLIEIRESHEIQLTESGLEIAFRVYDSYAIFKQFLCQLGVSEEAAEHDACRIELFRARSSSWGSNTYWKEKHKLGSSNDEAR